jgi:outer membrane lipoprotein-sorting protein
MSLVVRAGAAVIAAGLVAGVGGVLRRAAAEPPPVRRAKQRAAVRRAAVRPAAKTADPRVLDLLRRVEKASLATKTMTADFTYTVAAVDRQQFVAGSVRLMKPNYARIAFSYLAAPAYPNVFASDGQKVYTFTPESFQTDTRTFRPGPFDPLAGARAASGLEAGGGKIEAAPVTPHGMEIRLWDSIAVQAFFDPEEALGYLYSRDPSELKYEGVKTLNGVPYRVLYHRFENGRIAGGAASVFHQRVYVGPDDLVHRYVLEFTSQGRPGIQIMRLDNIHRNAPMTASDFAFTPPAAP